jgi:hypothetical protein
VNRESIFDSSDRSIGLIHRFRHYCNRQKGANVSVLIKPITAVELGVKAKLTGR